MCGGRGTRFDASVEKPLFPIDGEPMVDRVRNALAASRVDTTHAVVSPQAPDTRAHLVDLPTIETPGDGYVEDLGQALDRVDPPVLTVAADLPLLTGPAVNDVLETFDGGALTVCVPAALKRALGVSLDEPLAADDGELAPTGVNVVGAGEETTHVTHDYRFAVNVNRLADARVAEGLV